MLPGIDGYQVCREIRHTSDVPIIMLSAKGETFDKVLGLELGADDYIIKPFDSKELVARVRAVLRRFQPRHDRCGQADEKCADLPGPYSQSDQLLCYLYGKTGGHAAEGAGASLFSCIISQTRYLRENSFWITSGAMSILAIPEP